MAKCKVAALGTRWRILISLLIALSVVSGCDGEAADGVNVNALWYAKTDGGEVSGGVTSVQIVASERTSEQPFSVDLNRLIDEGAGSQWTAATAISAVLAVLATAQDPSRVDLTYNVSESIDGPSAGGLLTAGALAALTGRTVDPTMAMTGTILPDGSLGAVGGIPAKIRGAAAQGIKTVFFPSAQRTATDPATGRQVDVQEVATESGVEAKPVDSIWEALPELTGAAIPIPNTADPTMTQSLRAVLRQRTKSVIADVRTKLKQLPPSLLQSLNGTSQTRIRAQTAPNLVRAARLADGDPVRAYAIATNTAENLAVWRESAGLQRAEASGKDLAVAKGAAQRAIDQELQSSRAALVQAAATQVDSMEQLVGLCDALSWGTNAYVQVDFVRDRISEVQSYPDLDHMISTVSRARFARSELLPTAVDAASSLPVSGAQPLDASYVLLDNYAQFLGYAAAANAKYADEVVKPDAADDDYQRAALAKTLWEGLPDLVSDIPQPRQRTVVTAAAAISYFMATTWLVADLAASSGVGSISVRDQVALDRHSSLAAETASNDAKRAVGAGLDPSYLQWVSGWGRMLASVSMGQSADGGQALRGIGYQWTSDIEFQLLLALATTTSSSPTH